MLDEFQTANLKLSKAGDMKKSNGKLQLRRGTRLTVMLQFLQKITQPELGVIIRDHDGHVKVAINKSLPLLLGPLEVEAKTLE